MGIAVALGGGAALGWAHIGVLRALEDAKIEVRAAAGTSIGALAAICFAARRLDALEHIARSTSWLRILTYLDLHMKRGAVLVNVSRASLIDRGALLDALASGQLGGVGLDPPYDEPGRADDPLLKFSNAIVTPHLAAAPRYNALGDFEELLTGLEQALR